MSSEETPDVVMFVGDGHEGFTEEDRQAEIKDYLEEVRISEEEMRVLATDSISLHELSDRVNLIGNNVTDFIVNHHSVLMNKDLWLMAKMAESILFSLYTSITNLNENIDGVDYQPVEEQNDVNIN